MKKALGAGLVALCLSVFSVFASVQDANALDAIAAGAKVSATETAGTTTFADGVSGVTVYNAGANEIFIAFNSVATAASIEIPSGATVTYSEFNASYVSIICSTGETATVYLFWTIR